MGSAYPKMGPGHPSYERLLACQAGGLWMCDSVDHNDPGGCSNPECFNFPFPLPGWEQARNEVYAAFERMMGRR